MTATSGLAQQYSPVKTKVSPAGNRGRIPIHQTILSEKGKIKSQTWTQRAGSVPKASSGYAFQMRAHLHEQGPSFMQQPNLKVEGLDNISRNLQQ
jgi:hypothetical protein